MSVRPQSEPARSQTSGGLSGHWVAALAVAVGVLGICLLALAFRPASSLLAHPLLEDAYYALSVARNLAQGNGLTIDGEMLTSGFQPLFTLVEAVPFLGPWSTDVSIRVITVVQVLVLMATGGVLGLIVRDHVGVIAARGRAVVLGTLIIFVATFFTINTAMNGLETGALFLAYALVWRYFQVVGTDSLGRAAVFGILLGLTVLVRVDAAVVVACLLLAVALLDGLKRAGMAAVTAAVTASPWFVYNLVAFGSIIPSGGSAQTVVDPSWFRVWQMLEAWSAALMPWLPLSRVSPTAAVVIRLALVAGIVVLVMRAGLLSVRRGGAQRGGVFALTFLAGYGLLAVYYVTTSYAIWFYGRYMAPLALLSAFAVSALFLRTVTRLRVAVLIGLAGIGCLAAVLHWSSFYPRNEMLDDQVALVSRLVPEGVVVSAGQAGTLGFFRDDVVNLDGKVNVDALKSRADIRGYLDREGIDWLCDWPSNVDRYLGAGRTGWVEVGREGQFVCVTRSSP